MTGNTSNHHRYGEVKTRLTIGAGGDFTFITTFRKRCQRSAWPSDDLSGLSGLEPDRRVRRKDRPNSHYGPTAGSRSKPACLGHVVEGLLVEGVDRYLRALKRPGSSSVPTLRPRRAGRAAVTTWVPHSAQNSRVTARSRSLRVNCFGGLSGVFEAGDRHRHEHVGRAAGNILAFAAVALRLPSSARPRPHSAPCRNSIRLRVS